jgi:hypothetical protein
MKASEILGRSVLDARDQPVGIVHDLRVRLPATTADGRRTGEQATPVVVALVVGPDDLRCRVSHAWGYAQEANRAPALLRVLLAGQAARTRVVGVGEVAAWPENGPLRLREEPR